MKEESLDNQIRPHETIHQVYVNLAGKRKPISASSMPFEEKEGKSASSHDSNSSGVQLHHLCEQGEESKENPPVIVT